MSGRVCNLSYNLAGWNRSNVCIVCDQPPSLCTRLSERIGFNELGHVLEGLRTPSLVFCRRNPEEHIRPRTQRGHCPVIGTRGCCNSVAIIPVRTGARRCREATVAVPFGCVRRSRPSERSPSRHRTTPAGRLASHLRRPPYRDRIAANRSR